MKAKTIWIIVGVIVLILIVANWNKIFGKSESKRVGGGFGGGVVNKQKSCEKDSDCPSFSKCKGGKCYWHNDKPVIIK